MVIVTQVRGVGDYYDDEDVLLDRLHAVTSAIYPNSSVQTAMRNFVDDAPSESLRRNDVLLVLSISGSAMKGTVHSNFYRIIPPTDDWKFEVISG